MNRFRSAIVCLLLCLGCGESREAPADPGPADPGPAPAPAPAGEPLTMDDMQAILGDVEADGAPSLDDRRVFDDGRYAIRWPFPLELQSRPSEASTRYSAEGRHEGHAYALIYFVHDAPIAEIADPGYLRFETHRFVTSFDGRETTTEEVQLPGDRPALLTRFVSTPTARDLHHELASFVVDRTMFFVHVVSVAAGVGEALARARTIEVLSAREDVEARPAADDDAPPPRVVWAEPPTASAADRAAAPRSDRAGQPSVANSCNQISVMGHCYETAARSVGHGYFSDRAACFAPHVFEEGPCPSAGRTGSCVLAGGGQVVHFYRGDENESVCGTFGGTYRPASPRVLPRNPT